MGAFVLAGDIGGTKTRVALLRPDLEIVDVARLPTPRVREELVGAIAEMAQRLRRAAGGSICAAGFGVAGIVAAGGHGVRAASNLPIAGEPLGPELEAALGAPVGLLNDGWASALGEYHRGEAAGRDPLLALFLGTGVGMGLIVGGQPYPGAGHCAGEAGHAFYRGDRVCVCGNVGCFETYMGGRFLAERATELLGPNGSGGPRSGADLLAALDDPHVAAVVEEAAVATEIMVHNLVHVLSPGAVVLGGGMIDGWPQLAQRVERYCRARCSPMVGDNLAFVRSRSGGDAVLWGAAQHALANPQA